MTASAVGWICTFCGLGTVAADKPVPGACWERDGQAHSWGRRKIVEEDADLVADLVKKQSGRAELIEQAVRDAAGEKFEEDDLTEGRGLVHALQVEGDGWQTALIELGRHTAERVALRTIEGWRCWRCGMPAGESVDGVVALHEGPGLCPVVGVHGWQKWWTQEGHAEALDTWDRHHNCHGAIKSEAAKTLFLELSQAAVPYEKARADAMELDAAAGKPATVESVEETGGTSSRDVKAPDDQRDDPSALAVLAAPPAKRGRGRPRKDGSAPAVAAPPAPRPSPARSGDHVPVVFDGTNHRSWEGKGPPADLLGSEQIPGEGYDPDELWAARDCVREIDHLIGQVADLQRGMAGEDGGHVFGEFTDELYRRLGKWTRRVREIERVEVRTRSKREKAAAE